MDKPVVRVPAVATVAQCREILDELRAALGPMSAGDVLVLDCSSLDRFDSAFAQLLVSLVVTLRSRGLGLRVLGYKVSTLVSEAFCCDCGGHSMAGICDWLEGQERDR